MSNSKSLGSRALGRANRMLTDARLRAAVRLNGESSFAYWGRRSDEAHGRMLEVPLGDLWLERSAHHFEFLKGAGLVPEHRLLDYGCANLAMARWLVPYLQHGNYVGIDVGRDVVQRGVTRMTSLGIDRRTYHVLTARSSELIELRGFEFDFIFVVSVMQYMEPRDFRRVLERFEELAAPEAIICLDYSKPEHRKEIESKGMHYYDVTAYRDVLDSGRFDVAIDETGADVPVAIFRRIGAGSAQAGPSVIRGRETSRS